MMKRFIAAALLLCMVLGLCACGGTVDPTEPAPTAEPTTAPIETAAPETEAPTEGEFNGYTVTVLDEAGNPIAGAMVQLCLEACFPGATDENGVARFDMEEAEYKASFLFLPEGYTYSTDAQEFYFESGSKDMTIVLKAA